MGSGAGAPIEVFSVSFFGWRSVALGVWGQTSSFHSAGVTVARLLHCWNCDGGFDLNKADVTGMDLSVRLVLWFEVLAMVAVLLNKRKKLIDRLFLACSERADGRTSELVC